MTFGNAFGLALYDKQQREVTGGASGGGDRSSSGQASRPRSTPLRVVPQAQAAATPKAEPPSTSLEAAAASPNPDPGLAPLDQATIRQLHTTIRALPAPVLEGFSKAFRKRFQVPAEATSIADRICQRRHHDWIETFLVQHQSPPEAAAALHG